MNGIFPTYFKLGFEHISDLGGYDHIVFLIALCAIYPPSQWKRLLILVTAFTIGHSLTLALTALNWLPTNDEFVETLIPLTILATAIHNVLRPTKSPDQRVSYALALGFGLIHGMGFSNYFRAMLLPGEEGTLLSQLLAFNIGLEVGQLLIVALILAVTWVALEGFSVRQREWNLFISGAAAGISVVLALG